LYSDYLYVS
jgi:hypothetical protein